MVTVAVRRPAGSAVDPTGHAHVRDLRSGPPLGGSGSHTNGGTPGEGGCGGAAEGQLTVLSHPGLQVRPDTHTHTIWLKHFDSVSISKTLSVVTHMQPERATKLCVLAFIFHYCSNSSHFRQFLVKYFPPFVKLLIGSH